MVADQISNLRLHIPLFTASVALYSLAREKSKNSIFQFVSDGLMNEEFKLILGNQNICKLVLVKH